MYGPLTSARLVSRIWGCCVSDCRRLLLAVNVHRAGARTDKESIGVFPKKLIAGVLVIVNENADVLRWSLSFCMMLNLLLNGRTSPNGISLVWTAPNNLCIYAIEELRKQPKSCFIREPGEFLDLDRPYGLFS